MDDLKDIAAVAEIAGRLSEEKRGKVYDKTGREIMLGDVIKVYHFTGARWRKRYFMYKQVVGERFWPNGHNCWFLSHLTMKDGDGYYLARDGKVLDGYEIVQSIDAAFHDRPRRPSAPSSSNPETHDERD